MSTTRKLIALGCWGLGITLLGKGMLLAAGVWFVVTSLVIVTAPDR